MSAIAFILGIALGVTAGVVVGRRYEASRISDQIMEWVLERGQEREDEWRR